MISIDAERCCECGGCVGVCPFDALYLESSLRVTQDCTDCMFCVEFCPVEALSA